MVYAKGLLKLNDRVKIKDLGCANWAKVGNAGTVETNIGVQTELGNILSRAKVVVRDRGIVHGFIHTSDHLEKGADTQITGPVEEHATVLLPDLVLNVPFPGVTMGTIELEPNQSHHRRAGLLQQPDRQVGRDREPERRRLLLQRHDPRASARTVIDSRHARDRS